MSNKRKSTAALIPQRRFSGFSGPWAFKPLSSVLSEHKAKNTAGHEVFSVSMESGIVNQIEHLGRSYAAADTSNYNVGHRFDVVYTKSPLKAFPFGIVKQCKFDGEVALSPLYGVFTPKNPYVGLMIEAYFEAPERAQAFLSPLCQKGAKNTLQITNATFLSGRMALPKEEGEQEKIAECLDSADALIAAQGRKVEALRAHKKGLLQQLFPQEGETQPRLRFPEFEGSGEWIEEKLDDIFHFQDGFSFKSPDFIKTNEDATQVVRITDINNKNTNEDKVYIPNAFLEANNLKKYYVENGDLLLSLTGAAGFNFFFWDGDNAVINQRTSKVTPKKKLNPAMARLLEPLVHKKINARGEGQNNNLSKGFLSSVILLIPEPAEQQRIADCLTALDVLIAAETQKLDTLKAHKKGLMQQLFPRVGERDA
jgi:type I restriction enzyme, S subunit